MSAKDTTKRGRDAIPGESAPSPEASDVRSPPPDGVDSQEPSIDVSVSAESGSEPSFVARATSHDTRVSPGVEPGAVLANKFRVERVINSGGMGIILVAHHLQLDQRVAIKVLRAQALDDPEIVARFAREARVAAKIKSEHVVRVIDVGSLPNGAPYMVMEHLEGSDLSALVKARGPLPAGEAVEYVLQACEALAEAHIAGVVHRDLKPANLFLTRRADGSPSLKVLDFGISKIVEPIDTDSAMTKTSMMMGSPHYMSPEQLRSARRVDGRADVWALGVVLYRLVSGKNPFQADTTPELCVEILHGKPVPLAKFAPNAPAGLGDVIERCLQKKPENRFATVAELAHALEPFASERARTSIERVSGVYRAAPPAKDSSSSGPHPSNRPTRRERVSEPQPSEGFDVTDVGARTLSEKSESVAASVADTAPRRRGPVLLGALLAVALGAVGAWRLTARHAAGDTPSASAVTAQANATASGTDTSSAPTVVANPPETSSAVSSAAGRPRAVLPAVHHVPPAVNHTASAAASAPSATPASPPPAASSDPKSRFGGPF